MIFITIIFHSSLSLSRTLRPSPFLSVPLPSSLSLPPPSSLLPSILQTQTDGIAKIPQIVLSISWKGVKFVDAQSKVRCYQMFTK